MRDTDPKLRLSTDAAAEAQCQVEVYSSLLAPDIVSTFQELGLTADLAEVLTLHLNDLLIVVDSAASLSRLGIGAALKDGKTVWHREAIVSPTQIDANRAVLTDALDEAAPKSVDESRINKLALDWIMFELAADALGNTVYMLDRYGKYVPDLDLQKRVFSGELTVASKYAETADLPGRASRAKLKALHSDFRTGFGLVMLRDDLLLMGVEKAQQAAWVIEYIRNKSSRFDANEHASAVNPFAVEKLSEYVSACTEVALRRPDLPEIAANVIDLASRRPKE